VFAAPVAAEGVIGARLADPTGRYDHAVLGDALEWGTLEIQTDTGRTLRLILPETRVFEDVEARVADLDGDGAAEVIVVESDLSLGARLAVFGPDGLRVATDFIGQRHRWLAPAAIGDLDGDGQVEIAYVDRPHLAKELVILRSAPGALTEIARLPGLSNHRIGDSTISGGLRRCASGPVVLLADAGWQRAVAVTFAQGRITPRDLGPIPRGGLDMVDPCG
jgi:hypothetical protein